MRQRNWLFGFAAAAIVAVASSFASVPALADDAWDNCAQVDDLDRALTGCNEVIGRGDAETDENRAIAYFDRGNVYRAKEDVDNAIADFTTALKFNPDYASAWFNRAHAYAAKGNHKQAIEDYSEAIRLAPEDSTAWYNRGNSYSDSDDPDSAIADFTEAIRLNPQYEFAFFNRGNAHYVKSEFDLAYDDYTAAIGIEPSDADAFLNRADVLSRLGRYEESIPDYDKALELKPDLPAAQEGRDLAVKSLGDQREAATTDTPSDTTADATDDAATTADATSDTSATPGDTTPVATGETRVALVIGNSDYQAVAQLPNPPRDADAVADALRGSGFTSVTVIDNVTRKQFIDALNSFADEASNADWAVLYFAGHGIEMDGVNYMIPIDAQLKSDRDVEDEAISLDRMVKTVEAARKLRLVILDACRNNPFVSDMKMTGGTRSVHRGLARVEPDGGTLVAYAAKGGQEAIDGDNDNSPFATALVKRLDTPGLEIGKLFRLVRDDVLAATGRKQEPFVYGSLPGEDFFFRAN